MSDKIEQAVLAAQTKKIESGRALEAAIDAELAAQQQLKDAQKHSASARREAIKAGWDERTLRQLGLVTLRRKPRQAKPELDSSAEIDLMEGMHQNG